MPVADLFLIVSVYCVANQVVHFESTVILYKHKNAKAKKWNIKYKFYAQKSRCAATLYSVIENEPKNSSSSSLR